MQVFNIFPLHISQLETCKKIMKTEKAFRQLKTFFLAFFLLLKIMPLQCSKEFIFMRERERKGERKKKMGCYCQSVLISRTPKTLFRFG